MDTARVTRQVKLSSRRQVTLPEDICNVLGVQPGDHSDITEEELQEEGRRVRERLVREMYGKK